MRQAPVNFITVLALIGGGMLLVLSAHLALRGLHVVPESQWWDIPDGDPQRGRLAIQEYGCGACHTVPGIRHATGRVGPQLFDFRNQVFIAGVLPNTPENLIFWIRHPIDVNPITAMPDLGVTEQEARDIAAYLYSVE